MRYNYYEGLHGLALAIDSERVCMPSITWVLPFRFASSTTYGDKVGVDSFIPVDKRSEGALCIR
jgi:hypothetical protein